MNASLVTFQKPAACRGPGGEAYKTWFGDSTLNFRFSPDGGKTWREEQKLHAIKSAANYRMHGAEIVNRPCIVCDTGNSKFKNRIYICWSDIKHGPRNADVFFTYSDDKGETWSDAILVTYHPNHKMQFKPQVKIDSRNGDLYISYYDMQNYTEEQLTDVYLARSSNGGQKFEYFKLNQEALPVMRRGLLEHSINLSHDDIFCVNWYFVDRRTNFYSYHKYKNCDMYWVEAGRKTYSMEIKMEKSWKFADKIKIDFMLPQDCKMTVLVTKPLQSNFEKTVFRNRKYKAGNNSLLLDAGALKLEKSTYTLFFYYNGLNSFCWITEE